MTHEIDSPWTTGIIECHMSNVAYRMQALTNEIESLAIKHAWLTKQLEKVAREERQQREAQFLNYLRTGR